MKILSLGEPVLIFPQKPCIGTLSILDANYTYRVHPAVGAVTSRVAPSQHSDAAARPQLLGFQGLTSGDQLRVAWYPCLRSFHDRELTNTTPQDSP